MAQHYPENPAITSSLAGIVLAAGFSSRMREGLKPLKPLGSATLLEHALNALQTVGAFPLYVVTGHRHELLEHVIAELGATPVHNPLFEQGMFASVRAGVATLRDACANAGENFAPASGFLLLPVDAAPVRPASVNLLANAWRDIAKRYGPAISSRAVLIPVYKGGTGHPPVIGAGHIPDVLGCVYAQGLRGYLASLLQEEAATAFMQGRMPEQALRLDDCADGLYPFPLMAAPAADAGSPVFFLQLPDACLAADVDTPEDYAAAQAYFQATRALSRPTPEEAWEWLRIAGLPQEKVRHSLKVAQAALRLALALNDKGDGGLDAELIFSAALAHDVARGCMAGPRKCKDHARKGAELALNLGWRELAFIVGAHTVLPDELLDRYAIALRDVPVRCFHKDECSPGKNGMPLPLSYQQEPACRDLDLNAAYLDLPQNLAAACLVVYLADKYFFMDAMVSVGQRYGQVKTRFADDAVALKAIGRRERVALAVERLIAEKLGADPVAAAGAASAHPLDIFAENLLRDLPPE